MWNWLKKLLGVEDTTVDIRPVPRKRRGKKPYPPGKKLPSLAKRLKGYGDRHITTDTEREEIYDLYISGTSVEQLGKAYYRSHGCVYHQIHKEKEIRNGKQMGRLPRQKTRTSKEEK